MSATIEVDALPEVPWTDREKRERNAERAESAGLEPCLFCGRGVKDPLARQVHMTTQGTLFPVEASLDEHPESQGWFPIGPECAKKAPKGYAT